MSFLRGQWNRVRDDDLGDLGTGAEPLDSVSRENAMRSGDVDFRLATVRFFAPFWRRLKRNEIIIPSLLKFKVLPKLTVNTPRM